MNKIQILKNQSNEKVTKKLKKKENPCFEARKIENNKTINLNIQEQKYSDILKTKRFYNINEQMDTKRIQKELIKPKPKSAKPPIARYNLEIQQYNQLIKSAKQHSQQTKQIVNYFSTLDPKLKKQVSKKKSLSNYNKNKPQQSQQSFQKSKETKQIIKKPDSIIQQSKEKKSLHLSQNKETAQQFYQNKNFHQQSQQKSTSSTFIKSDSLDQKQTNKGSEQKKTLKNSQIQIKNTQNHIQNDIKKKIKEDYINFIQKKQIQVYKEDLLKKQIKSAIKIQANFRGYKLRKILNNFVSNYKIADYISPQSQKQSQKIQEESFCLFDEDHISPIQQFQQSPQVHINKFDQKQEPKNQFSEWQQIKEQIQKLQIGDDQETKKLLENLEKKFLQKLTPEPKQEIVNDSFIKDYSNLRNFIGSEQLLKQSWDKQQELQNSNASNISQQFFRNSFNEFIQKKLKDLMNQENMQQLLEARQKVLNMRVNTEKRKYTKKLQKNDITPETFKQKTRDLEFWKQREITELDRAQRILQKNWQITSTIFKKTKADMNFINKLMENKSNISQFTQSEENQIYEISDDTLLSEDYDTQKFETRINQSDQVLNLIINQLVQQAFDEINQLKNTISLSYQTPEKKVFKKLSQPNKIQTVDSSIDYIESFMRIIFNNFDPEYLRQYSNKNIDLQLPNFPLPKQLNQQTIQQLLLDSLKEDLQAKINRQNITYKQSQRIIGETMNELVSNSEFQLGYLNCEDTPQVIQYRKERMDHFIKLELFQSDKQFYENSNFNLKVKIDISKQIEDFLINELVQELI